MVPGRALRPEADPSFVARRAQVGLAGACAEANVVDRAPSARVSALQSCRLRAALAGTSLLFPCSA